MSLATRCPACGTIFRVVQDQLKVSDGWVRCGQCHEVFHGVEALFDLESDPVVAARQGAQAEASAAITAPPRPVAEEQSEAAPADAGAPHPFARRPMAPRFAARLAEETARAHERPASSSPAPQYPSGFAPASRFGDVPTDEPAPREPAFTEPAATAAPGARVESADDVPIDVNRFTEDDEDAGPLTLASMLPDASEWPSRPESRRRRPARVTQPVVADSFEGHTTLPAEPERTEHRFLRESRSDAFWKRPAVRITLGFVAVVLGFTATAQVAWPLRDTLAARWPAARSLFALACQQLNCRLESPRSLSSLALDSSSLTRTDTDHVLLFSADLHNRSEQEVRVPAFDLTFMDLNGEIVARKVLAPEQIGIHQASLPAEAELHVHARLDVGTLDATGFHAEMFYP